MRAQLRALGGGGSPIRKVVPLAARTVPPLVRVAIPSPAVAADKPRESKAGVGQAIAADEQCIASRDGRIACHTDPGSEVQGAAQRRICGGRSRESAGSKVYDHWCRSSKSAILVIIADAEEEHAIGRRAERAYDNFCRLGVLAGSRPLLSCSFNKAWVRGCGVGWALLLTHRTHVAGLAMRDCVCMCG